MFNLSTKLEVLAINVFCREDKGTGHRLGAAQQLTTQPVPERQLSPAQTSVLRLLTHMALYLGANNNPQVSSHNLTLSLTGTV